MSDDDVELNHLRERVYGETGAPATAEEIARLSVLEDRARVRRDRSPASDHTPSASPPAGEAMAAHPPAHPARAGAGAGADAEGDDDRPPDAAPPRHRTLAVVAALAVAGVLLGAGYVAGAASPAFVGASSSPSPAPSAGYPELAFPQTDDDVIASSILDDSGIDPASARYIAVMSGFRVFLARAERGDGVCVITLIVVNEQPWSAGCTTGGPFGDGAAFGIDQRLSIALGDTSRMSIRGTPVRLSQSVTAYVVE